MKEEKEIFILDVQFVIFLDAKNALKINDYEQIIYHKFIKNLIIILLLCYYS